MKRHSKEVEAELVRKVQDLSERYKQETALKEDLSYQLRTEQIRT